MPSLERRRKWESLVVCRYVLLYVFGRQVGNHGTARNTQNSTEEKTRNTASLTEKTERLRKWDDAFVCRYVLLYVFGRQVGNHGTTRNTQNSTEEKTRFSSPSTLLSASGFALA